MCVTVRAGRQGAAAILAPETGFLHQTVSRLPIANHVLLGSWMVDICQEGHSLRWAPQRRHMAHLRWYSPGNLGNRAARTREVIKTHGPTGTGCSPSAWYCLSCSDLGRAQNACPPKSVPLWSTREPEWQGPL